MFNYRIDWIDRMSGEHCVDWVTEETARWEAQNDIYGEIISITKILNEDGNESENLLEIFRNF